MTAGRIEGRRDRTTGLKLLAAALVAGSLVAACSPPTRQHGYILSESALEQVPVGSSREQVLLVLGTPSTSSTLAGDAYYYISQTVEENPVFGRQVSDQRVLAVYFDENGTVTQIANYGLQDGKVFDFIERKTRAGGRDLSLLTQILGAVGNTNPFQN